MVLRGYAHGLAVGLLLLLCVDGSAQGTLGSYHGQAQDDRFGYCVSRAGDMDNDGFGDFLIGSFLEDDKGADSGGAHVYSGRKNSLLYAPDGDSPGDWLGHSVSGGGDVNNDGFTDFVVGAPWDDNNGSGSGTARVFSGKNGSVLFDFVGAAIEDNLGWAVSIAGDVNRDGFVDVFAGAPAESTNGLAAGRATVYSGVNGSVLHTFLGDHAGDLLGVSLAAAGDIDNDGYADLVAGARGDDNVGTASGSARVFSGKNGSILFTFDGDSAGDLLGFAVDGAGDLDNDGFDDLLTGAPHDDKNGAYSGTAQAWSGKNGSVLYTFSGDSTGDLLGAAVGNAGDVDGDGRADIAVGAHQDDASGIDSGTALVFSGADGSLLHSFGGDMPGDNLGRAVASAGDVNNDGFADVIVGAPSADAGGFDAGSARVLSGTCGAVTNYGQGCPGTGGLVPFLTVTGCPTPGGWVTLEVSNALGGAYFAMLVGAQKAALEIGGGCTLNVYPPIGPIGPLPLGGVGPGNGSLSLPAQIPVTTPVLPMTIQAFFADPAGVIGSSASNGVEMEIR